MLSPYHQNNEPILSKVRVIFGTVVCLVSFLSYLPQHYLLVTSRGVSGLSSQTVFLSNVGAVASFFNVLVLKRNQLCWSQQCISDALTFAQVLSSVLGNFPIFVLLIFYSQRDCRVTNEERQRIVNLFAAFILFIFTFVSLIISTVALYSYDWETVASRLDVIALVAGIGATVAALFQWTPQILLTYKSRYIGAISIATLSIQAPGSIVVVSLFLYSGEAFSTWFAFAVCSLQQLILLIMVIYLKSRVDQQLPLSGIRMVSNKK